MRKTAVTSKQRDFDKEAAGWDDNPTRVRLAEDVVAAVLRQVRLAPDLHVLDFGCGTGLVALRLAPLVKCVTGADTSCAMLEVLASKAAHQRLGNVHPRLIEPGASVPGTYDVIVSSMTFHHVEHTEALLASLFQALKPPGCLCVVDLDLEGGEFHQDNTGVFHFGFDRGALAGLFRDAGFTEVTATTASEVVKPVRGGAERKFSVFLMTGQKVAGRPPGGHEATPRPGR